MKKVKLLKKLNLFCFILLMCLYYKDCKNDMTHVQKNIKTFEIDNQDFIILYDEYLNILSKRYEQLDIDNIFNEFSFMLKNGLISYGNSFEVDTPELDASKYGGIDVINGKGVCRNVNCCFTDLLNKMGYDAGNMYGILETGNKIYIKPNHVITWVKINDKIYLYDVANNTRYNKIVDIYYNENKKLLFIPTHVTTKVLGEDLYLDTVLYHSENNNVIEIEHNDITNYLEFERENLLDIEKKVYIKIKSLQTN